MKRLAWQTWVGAAAITWLIAAGCSGKAVVDGGSGGSQSTSSQSSGANGSSSSGSTGSTSSGGSGFDLCNGPGQCELTYPGCCENCGTPQLVDLVPVALEQLGAFHQSQCPTPEPCPDCISCPNGEIFAHCEANHCVGSHLDDFGLRDCTQNTDCRLRWGAGCYEPCGAIAECGGLTAINVSAEAALADLVCDPNAPPPPPCVPTYPPDAQATCNAGRCEVVFVDF